MSTPLEKKTIRPGKLSNYSYYYSDRHPISNAVPLKPKRAKKSWFKWAAACLVLAFLVIGLPILRSGADSDNSSSGQLSNATNRQPAPAAANVTPTEPEPVKNACQNNTEAKAIIVGVEARHLWACEGSKTVIDAPVITGLRGHAETETPVGTYKIYGKMQNTTLTGQDSRGSWRDPVYYWMPFLDNQYGTYGFHDATWRNDKEFGQISPDSNDASHGCVEVPLDTQRQLYEWAPVGTPLTIQA